MDSALFLYCESYYDDPDIGPKSAEAIVARLFVGALDYHWANSKRSGASKDVGGDPLVNLFKEIMSNGSN